MGFKWGGSGGVRTKSSRGMRLLDKLMILQGVKLTIQPLGLGYANRPKKAKMGGYVAGGGGRIMTPPFFGSKITNFLLFSILSRKSLSKSRLHSVCMGRSGTSAYAVYITSQRLLDQSQAGVFWGKCHITPHFGFFGAIRVPYPWGLNW